MDTTRIKIEDIDFVESSSADPTGRVFSYNNRILRIIYHDEDAKMIKAILNKPWINELFDLGVVKTWIAIDFNIDGVALVLEHERIPYITYPGEWTDFQFWEACKKLLEINLFLLNRDYILKDLHPWNIQFQKGEPVFIDFASIKIENTKQAVLDSDMYKYCLVPIFLANRKITKKYSREYRRETNFGFGLGLACNRWIMRLFSTFVLSKPFKREKATHYTKRLLNWMNKHKPAKENNGEWSNYEQYNEIYDFTKIPELPKDKFVYEILRQIKSGTVLDIAANKGLYSEMAVFFNHTVMAFDYEEHCVNVIGNTVKTKKLNITYIWSDFRFPSPAADFGLNISDGFVRFQSDIVIAMGLIHHVCIIQKLPVYDFCNIILKYARKGIIWEYVFMDDVHVSKWKAIKPMNYSVEYINKFFSKKFPNNSEFDLITEDGVKRKFIYNY